jgi:hypothetical protein
MKKCILCGHSKIGCPSIGPNSQRPNAFSMSLIPGALFKSRVRIHQGYYVFHKNKHVPKTGTTYYVCRSRACHGTGVLKQGQEFKQTQAHIGHPPCKMEEMKSVFIEKLKERAEEETTLN